MIVRVRDNVYGVNFLRQMLLVCLRFARHGLRMMKECSRELSVAVVTDCVQKVVEGTGSFCLQGYRPE